MTVESDIFDRLSPLVGGRVYPDIAPEGSSLPRITYFAVGGSSVTFLDPTIPSRKNARMQINCFATTRAAAATLSRLVEDSLRTSPVLLPTILGAPVSAYEPDTKIFSTRQDASIWFES